MGESDQAFRENSEFLVLVVDDDVLLRELACEALAQAGFNVAQAENGRQGLEEFQRLQPDILLLDVLMPELDGFSLCRSIRRLPAGSETPILMMTGLEDTKAIDEAYDAGATDFISKPLSWIILCHRVRYMLRSSKTLQDLQISKAHLSNAHRIARMGTWEWDLAHDKLHWSREIDQVFAINRCEFNAIYQTFLKSIYSPDTYYLNQTSEKAPYGQGKLSLDHLIVLSTGEACHCHTEGEVFLSPEGFPVRISGTIQDITDRKLMEEQVRTLAYSDSVTGLPNRNYFKEHLHRVLAYAKRTGTQFAVLFLDLDRFKEINDTLGHATGDQLLKGIAVRLSQCVRAYDTVCCDGHVDKNSTVARLGGDEFTIVLENMGAAQDVTVITQRILKSLADPFLLGGIEIFVSISIGISVYPHDGVNCDDLLKNADVAMYHAKKEGRNNAQFFTQELNDAALDRLVLESRLHTALVNNEFILHYQPQMDALRKKIIGLEALIRWNSPELGMVAPGDFIPLAEGTSQILLIDEWVVATVCRQIRIWLDQGFKPPRVAVNISGLHFRRKSLVEMVARNLSEAGISGNQLELEVTESIVMQNVEESVSALVALRALGVTISIDDFGTGYSSLSYLRRFPVDTLKIDRSFIRELDRNEDNATITSAIISMAKTLKLGVVAEGVETAEQLQFLHDNGCTVMQGFFFSRPMPPEDVIRLLPDEPSPSLPAVLSAITLPCTRTHPFRSPDRYDLKHYGT